MKKYNVFKVLGADWSPILKYSTDEYNDAVQVAKLLKKQDDKHEYVILTPITE